MRNTFFHLSISTMSLKQGTSFVITSIKSLICHQSMTRWAGTSKRLRWWCRNEEDIFIKENACLTYFTWIEDLKKVKADSPGVYHLSNLWSVNYSDLATVFPTFPSSQYSLLPVADDIVTLIRANCSMLNGFSHIANDMLLVSVTMFPQKNSMGTGNLHKWM